METYSKCYPGGSGAPTVYDNLQLQVVGHGVRGKADALDASLDVAYIKACRRPYSVVVITADSDWPDFR